MGLRKASEVPQMASDGLRGTSDRLQIGIRSLYFAWDSLRWASEHFTCLRWHQVSFVDGFELQKAATGASIVILTVNRSIFLLRTSNGLQMALGQPSDGGQMDLKPSLDDGFRASIRGGARSNRSCFMWPRWGFDGSQKGLR